MLLCVISKEVIRRPKGSAERRHVSRSRITDMQALRKISGHRWQKLRERILRRDASLCQPCKARGHITLAVEVDHITPIHKGGTDAEDNLQAICSECHKAKTAAEQGKSRRPQIGADGWPVGAG